MGGNSTHGGGARAYGLRIEMYLCLALAGVTLCRSGDYARLSETCWVIWQAAANGSTNMAWSSEMEAGTCMRVNPSVIGGVGCILRI